MEEPFGRSPAELVVTSERLRWDRTTLAETLRVKRGSLGPAERQLELESSGQMSDETMKRILEPVVELLLFLVSLLPMVQTDCPDGTYESRISNAIIPHGQTFPPSVVHFPKSIYIPGVVNHMDIIDNPNCLRLFRHCLSIVARMMKIRSSSWTSEDASRERPTSDCIAQWILDKGSSEKACALMVWLKSVFLKHWNGGIYLREGTISIACLRLLDSFATHGHSLSCGYSTPRHPPSQCKEPNMIDQVAQCVESIEMAQTWEEAPEHKENGRHHLLDFEILFKTSQRAEYFRILNHLRMQRAHDNAEKASALRQKVARSGLDPESDVRLKFLEDHYLLLNIGRNTVVSDALNQVWQRRSSELLRPLRVRLGEMDAFEVGHDLGGVQIEFFNLLCREIFSEQLGMFTADTATGLSYFRPGCLQPLYMFELFGLLFGLAVYNGITLPVNFPLVFYKRLLGLSCNGLDSIEDGWPAMHRSLSAILKEEIPGLEHVFAVEANGVRLSVSSFEEEPERETPKTTARVVEATNISHHSEPPDRKAPGISQPQSPTTNTSLCITPESLNWPGWSFESPSSGEPADITPANKHDYVKAYTTWLTYASVAAQWHLFLTGFHRVLPTPHLTIFTPRQLQSIIEGTRTISIPDLRAATEYEGYNPHSTYIHTFWSVVAAWPAEKQKQLLKFVTAAERVPAGGAGNVTFKVSRVGHPGAEEGLPTSSTCFGTLYLPR